MNPYKVLEIDQNATQEEIKQAYRRLVKKYHPDKYVDNPLSKLAEEKMRDINAAYDMLIGNGTQSTGNSSSYSGSSSSGTAQFSKLRQMINAGQYDQAMTILDNLSDRPAEWYYLKGACMMGKGWYAQAQNFYNMAYQMEPSNMEYQRAARSMYNSNRNFTNQTNVGSSGCSTCDICSCMLCSDCCCEAAGGDCIPCC
jgi:DnaJ-class molecular chaperone